MTLQNLTATHGHTWRIRLQRSALALRHRPLTVGQVTVHDLTLTAPDLEALAASIHGHDHLEDPA